MKGTVVIAVTKTAMLQRMKSSPNNPHSHN
jgi:hypothetical protein